MKAYKRVTYIGLLLLMLLASTGLLYAAGHEPTYGSAVVDGAYGEWDLGADHFAELYLAADPTKEIMGDVYLRYDCEAAAGPTLYALVLAREGHWITDVNDGEQHFIKLGNSALLVDGNDADNFAFVNLSSDRADGWEAAALLSPGTYSNLNVHTNMDQAADTAAFEGRSLPLEVQCNPSAVSLGAVSTGAVSNGFVFALSALGLLLVATTAVVSRSKFL